MPSMAAASHYHSSMAPSMPGHSVGPSVPSMHGGVSATGQSKRKYCTIGILDYIMAILKQY
jgi:hypothetical protein